MRPTDDRVGLLSRALDQAGRVIVRIRPEQATDPTPCRSWDVRALVGHVVDELHRFDEVTRTGRRGPSTGDVIGTDWTSAYRSAAAALLAAWSSAGALERTHRYPGGEVAAADAVGQQLAELVIHAWDLAAATGQDTALDPELGQSALDWEQAHHDPRFRGDEADGYQVAPERPVGDGASVYERLAAFAGRDPLRPLG